MINLELLAPAKNFETGVAAIDCGADAVYIGATHHGARAAASNSIDDIEKLCQYAHRFHAKVYVTVNTIIYEEELNDVKFLIEKLYNIGVDALIVQDMSILEMDIPPIPLHASTQCDIRTPQKAKFLQDVGFSQIVLPREMTLKEIADVRKNVDIPLEAFVHGALCVCFSGDCRASFYNGGRSANRGECAQICRLPYNLIDGKGNTIAENKHLLSLKDLNRLNSIESLIEAGVSSFKIEGRLKSVEYVKNVTAAYSKALNQFILNNSEKYRRASFGTSKIGFTPDVNKTFNRGYISSFCNEDGTKINNIASIDTPKHIGTSINVVKKAYRNIIELDKPYNGENGDGITFFDDKERFIGFRVNRFDKNRIYLTQPLKIAPSAGTILYRNYDKRFMDGLTQSLAKRRIGITFHLETNPNGLSLTVSDERMCEVCVTCDCEKQKSRTPQKEYRRKIFEKLGDTIYQLVNLIDNVDEDIFIPASVLTALRRRATDMLDIAAKATYPLTIRSKTDCKEVKYIKTYLDIHDNVSNSIAEQFYSIYGATVKEYAAECKQNVDEKLSHIMTSRYCVRNELGICLKTERGRKIKGPLKLVALDNKTKNMILTFDCSQCLMHVHCVNK